VLFLTMHEEEGMLLEALNAGGDGYVIKRADQPEIIQAIRVACRPEGSPQEACVTRRQSFSRASAPQPATSSEADVDAVELRI